MLCFSFVVFVLFFFFYSYGAHRVLHSFPTRRSSDLDKEELYRTVIQYAEERAAESGPADVAPGAPRSEEHTSELQSHSDLVCRLLLEKKKKKKKNKQ